MDDDEIPPYAILSHTWKDGHEVTFKDVIDGTSKSKIGYDKIRFCGQQTERDGLQYFWVDTCCIDKLNHVELQEAINSMFRWYQKAAKCYVYLSDVATAKRRANDEHFEYIWESAFRESRWFTRGWTLQELLAPRSVEFFSREGKQLGDKRTLERTIHEITGIAIPAIRGTLLYEFGIEERLLWAKSRQTTRKEDKAYSLLGIFGIYMPLIYGEGEEHAFKRLREEIRKTSGNQILSRREEQKKHIIGSLRFDQIDARQMTIRNACARTCNWLLETSEYLNWLDADRLSEHHVFLWIKGKPGTGKSTLMKFALINASKTMDDKIIISFFFNARGEDIERSTVGTYRSLLLQLLERLPALQSIYDSPEFSKLRLSTDHQWNIEWLRTLLEKVIKCLGEFSVVCFIDALDECEEKQIRDMIQFFEHVGSLNMSSGIRFRVCFSSRHYPHITIRKGLALVLERQEGHTQDIAKYLEIELKIGQSKIAQQIQSGLQEKASGIFMWVILVVGILNKEYDGGRIHALRRRVQEIPGDLHELFHDILTRDAQNRDELLRCIQWVLFAKQPLSPEQLYFAILSGVEPDAVSRRDPTETTRDVIKRFVLNSSKGLVDITTTTLQKVQFIHESVRDFLLKDALSNTWPDLGSNLQGQSHEQLKQCCLNYMSTDIFTLLNVPESLPHASSQHAADLRRSAADGFPFLKYALDNVLYHADAAERCGISQAEFLRSFPLSRWIKLHNLFKKYEVHKHTKGMSLLYALAEHNMPNLIKVHASDLSSLEVGNEHYGPPLFAAMATGGKEAVEVFMKCFVMNRSLGSHFDEWDDQSCLYEGISQSFSREFNFSRRRTVLSYLAELGMKRMLSILLDTGKVDVDVKDEDGRTPLSWAAQNGHEAVVKLLLNTGKVNVDAKDSQYSVTPLSWAAENGHQAVVKLLLDTGKVNVDAKDEDGRTALSWAAQNGHDAVVKLLLDTGKVNVDEKDSQYSQTPLLLEITPSRSRTSNYSEGSEMAFKCKCRSSHLRRECQV
jgi:hypothetical protein